MAKLAEIKQLNEIVEKTIQAIENGKKEIFEIGEKARETCDEIECELIQIQEELSKIIKEVDKLEVQERASRKRLLMVSKDFNKYSEKDIKEAYENASELQLQLSLKRQQEKQLINQRTILEMRLKKAREVLEKSDSLASKVGVALDYLSGNLQGIFEHLEDMKHRQIMGIKIIKAQEDERQRVSREIHDGPAQSMANVVLKAELCSKLIDYDVDKVKKELNELKVIVRESLKDIRKIIYDLMPMSLDDLGLVPTIQRLVTKFKDETNIDVDFIVTENGIIKVSIIELTVFRIIQEALSNIKKHSRARKVSIILNIGKENIYLKIVDDGIGFNVNEKVNSNDTKSGFGLYNIRDRVNLLNGKLEIDSKINSGTILNVMIPIYEEE